jgi:hypothetical protein
MVNAITDGLYAASASVAISRAIFYGRTADLSVFENIAARHYFHR